MHAHCQSSFILGVKRGVCNCNKIMLKEGQNSICLSQEAHPVTPVSHWPCFHAPKDHKPVSQQDTPKYTAMAAVQCHCKTSTVLVCLFICLMSIHCMQNWALFTSDIYKHGTHSLYPVRCLNEYSHCINGAVLILRTVSIYRTCRWSWVACWIVTNRAATNVILR